MTDDQLKQYWKEINTPYTKEELSGHKENRELKGLLELTHYDNYVLESLACEWYDYRYNGGKRPSRNIWTLLTPAHNQVNAACERLTRIVEIYCEHDYPTLEPIPILFFCSRSTATLIQRLEELHYTPHIDTLHSVTSDFFFILAGGSRRNYTRAQLREVLMDCIKRFTEACDANAKELHKFLLDFIQGNKPSRPLTHEDAKALIAEDGEKTRRTVKSAKADLTDVVKRATSDKHEGCHHPDKKKDALVQKVILYLAKPGVTFSINDACCKIAGKTSQGHCKLQWLYMWCHRNEKTIRDTIDILRV